MQGLAPGLIKRIHLAVVKPTALYGMELWWRGQKNHEQTLQKLINRQACSITGIYRSTSIHPLLSEAGLIPANILLDSRQKKYAYRLLTLPDEHPAKNTLPISMREGNGSLQPGEQPDNTLMWIENTKPPLSGHRLAPQLALDNSIDPAGGIEPVENSGSATPFPGEIIVERKKKEIERAKNYQAGIVFWVDGSKVDNGDVEAAVTWKDKNGDKWKEKSVGIGQRSH